MVHNSMRQNFRNSQGPRRSNTRQHHPKIVRLLGKWRQSSSLPNAVSSARLLGDDDFYLGLLAERNIPSQGVRSSPVQGHMKRRWRTLLSTTGNLLEPRNLNTSYEKEAERCAKKGKLATTMDNRKTG